MKLFVNADKKQSVSPEIPEDYEAFPITLESISSQPLSIVSIPNDYKEATVNVDSKSITVLVQVGIMPEEEVIKNGNDIISGRQFSTIVSSGSPLVK